MKNLIKIVIATVAMSLALSASTIKIGNTQYEEKVGYNYIQIQSKNIYEKIIPCENIPSKVWIADRWFANLDEDRIIVCQNFIYKANTKKWYIKK